MIIQTLWSFLSGDEAGMAEESEEQEEEEGEEEGMVEQGEEVEARNPRGERRSAGRPNLTDDQRTFLIMQKSFSQLSRKHEGWQFGQLSERKK